MADGWQFKIEELVMSTSKGSVVHGIVSGFLGGEDVSKVGLADRAWKEMPTLRLLSGYECADRSTQVEKIACAVDAPKIPVSHRRTIDRHLPDASHRK